jgi:hypothetical protein
MNFNHPGKHGVDFWECNPEQPGGRGSRTLFYAESFLLA